MTEPEPPLSATVPALVVPSPQLHRAVWVSVFPGSVKLADAVIGLPSDTGDIGAVMAPTVGGMLVTVNADVPELVL